MSYRTCESLRSCFWVVLYNSVIELLNNNQYVQCRAVGRSENPGVPALFGGHNLPPLVEIGLTDLSKSGDAMAWYLNFYHLDREGKIKYPLWSPHFH